MTLYIIIAVIIILAVSLAIANYAPNYFQSKYKKISRYSIDSDLTAGDFLLMVANKYDFKGLKLVNVVDGNIDSCCFASKSNTVYIDSGTVNSQSIASFAVVSHEFGHAIQYNSGNIGFRVLNGLSAISIYLGKLAFPLLLVGLVMMLLAVADTVAYVLCLAGIIIFVVTFLTRLITIKIEFQASKYGLELLKENGFDKKSLRLAKQMLNSAGLTYVGSFFASILAWTLLVPKYKH